ncbi:hypothetical protein LbDm2_2266 [Levilactobacillus brevis]|nr:hypothetical protein LbDm2_2266 [Levilactobacillus brevis]
MLDDVLLKKRRKVEPLLEKREDAISQVELNLLAILPVNMEENNLAEQ